MKPRPRTYDSTKRDPGRPEGPPDADADLPPIDRVLSRLNGVTPSDESQWSACCPAHADSSPSLSVHETDKGDVLITCHAGCEFEKVVEALGMEKKDLFCRAGRGRQSASKPRRKRTSGKKTANKSRLRKKTPTPKKKSKSKPPKRKRRRLETAPGATQDWAAKVHKYEKALTPEQLKALAAQLGLPAEALRKLHVGWRALKDGTGCYTFPEFDAEGRVLGIAKRTTNGKKGFIKGGCRGLYLPHGWRNRRGPILIVEGATDTAALAAMGLAGVGRPSARGGVDLLSDLLADTPPDRSIVVVGEVDPKPDGRWPGMEGAKKVARALTKKLGRRVRWAFPPDGASKDVRQWLLKHQGGEEDE